ncbi:MAG: iron-containing alcohol dehydrogenase, partial [Aeromicrobium sp.]
MTSFSPDRPETVFTYGAPGLKFGVGARHELAFDIAQFNARRVLLITDPGVAATGTPGQLAGELRAAGLDPIVFDRSRIEPTDGSLIEAIEFARANGPFDVIVAVGGGSSIDTAKA